MSFSDLFSTIVPPSNSTPIHKDDCMFCFDTAEEEHGLDVCLSCFQSFSRGELNHTDKHFNQTGHKLFYNVRKIAKPKPEIDHQKPTKIAKLEVKEFDEEELFDIKESLYNIETNELVPLIFSELPDNVIKTITHVKKANSINKQNEIKSWEQEIIACAHSISISLSPKTSKFDMSQCSNCELKENLWICLHCGELNCGREQFGGIKGNSHALRHFEVETEKSHSVAVKLGSLSIDSADAYCYICNDEVSVPNLKELLEIYGINLLDHSKTEKNLTELQIDQNLKWEFNLDGKDGQKLKPVFGKNLTGLKNLGNSCYLNSVVQNLFQFESYQSVFSKLNFPEGITDPSTDLMSQFLKMYDGLASGRYSIPSNEDLYQKGIKPASFKDLIGKNHAEFSTSRQQDAFEFWLYLINEVEKLFPDLSSSPNKPLKFIIENKLKCQTCSGVRLSEELVDNLSIPIQDLLLSTSDDGSKKYQPVKLSEALLNFINVESIDLNCPKCESKRFDKSLHFKTFPEILVLNTQRIKLENWVPVKNEVPIPIEEELQLSDFKNTPLSVDEILLADNETPKKAFEPNQVVVNQLLEMGFPETRCLKAIYYTGNQSSSEAPMNWLFEHMEDVDIDEPLVIPDKDSTPSAAQPNLNESDVENLISMGFSRKLSTKALVLNDADINRAIEWVFSNTDDNGELPTDNSTSAIRTPESDVKEIVVHDSTPDANYRLKGVICHKGSSPHAGHYVTYINHAGQWTLFNDEKVVACDEVGMMEIEKSGYLYIYVKIGSKEDF